MMQRLIVCFALSLCLSSWSRADSLLPMTRCDPGSDFIEEEEPGLNSAFCAEWNPDFVFRGAKCCGKASWKLRRRGIRCSPQRAKQSFCDEMTQDQIQYVADATAGRLGDLLEVLEREKGIHGIQARCSPNDGFLAWGRPVIATQENRLILRRPDRCVHFGTDAMVGMLEWFGRRLSVQFASYPSAAILIGDISAPRGGCLGGKGGRRGHASHMTGQDVDVGFLTLEGFDRMGRQFHRNFDPQLNWWAIKQIFKNPFACVRAVFLDQRHIAKLRKVASSDPDWAEVSPFIRHVRSHKNHYHVRIGDEPGPPGCREPLERNLVAFEG